MTGLEEKKTRLVWAVYATGHSTYVQNPKKWDNAELPFSH